MIIPSTYNNVFSYACWELQRDYLCLFLFALGHKNIVLHQFLLGVFVESSARMKHGINMGQAIDPLQGLQALNKVHGVLDFFIPHGSLDRVWSKDSFPTEGKPVAEVRAISLDRVWSKDSFSTLPSQNDLCPIIYGFGSLL